MTPAPKRRWFRSRFVVDGHSRARGATEPEIRTQAIAKYSKQLEAAGIWGRLWLRLKINREISSRLNKVAPHDAHY
jgi:hypothetical protein